MDEVKLFAPGLSEDYDKPYLHQFMKMQEKSLSIWPAVIAHMTPRQSAGEQFVCVVDGELSIKLLSPVFSQHAYQGVYEELKP